MFAINTQAHTPVLIVEDEDVVAGAMTRWLDGLGYNLARAASAEEAADRMAPINPAVVICDVGLPGKDGLWLADRVRVGFPRTAVVLATGRNNIPPSQSMRGGVVSYLVKPFGRDQLRRAVSEAVTWHRDTAPAPVWNTRADAQLSAWFDQRLRVVDLGGDADAAVEALFPEAVERARIDEVLSIASTLSRQLRLSAPDHDDLAFAARLHRLWRWIVPAEIGDGANGYSHHELDALRRAPAKAADALAQHNVSPGVRRILRSLRERIDGLGVPERLVGDRIPLGSRILALAEAIEAMSHDRSDRPARSAAEIARELQRFAGTQFDSQVVRAAMKTVLAG